MHIEKKKFLIKTISDVVAWLAARKVIETMNGNYDKPFIVLFLSYTIHFPCYSSMLSGSIIISIIFIHMLEMINYIHLA